MFITTNNATGGRGALGFPGVPAPRLTIPDALGRGIAWGLERWSDLVTHEEPLATARSLAYLQRRLWFDTTKAKRELGLPETPLRTTIERAVRWFRESGMV